MTTLREYPGEQYDIARSYGHVPADVREQVAERMAGMAWGRTEGVAAVPADVIRNSTSGMHYAESAYVQCAEAGKSHAYCLGAFDAVYRILTWA